MNLTQEPSIAAKTEGGGIARASRTNRVAEALILAAVLAVPALVCMHLHFVTDPDVWWHMRTGEWIVQHHSIPSTELFTSFAAGKPDPAYSWLFELLIVGCFQKLGLVGFVAYTTALVLAITAAIYHLVRRLQPDFSIGALLALMASLSLMRLFAPRSWLFSILFLVLEIDVLMQARRTGKTRELLWLPLIFAIWANVHIQFFDGLLVLGLAVGEAVLARWWSSARTHAGAGWLGGIFAACVVATMANPFGWRVYQVGYVLGTQSGAKHAAEMQALGFRAWPDYFTLFLALAASAALAAPAARKGGELRRRFPVFETALLAVAAILSFRSGRDMWVMVTAGIAIVAQGRGGDERERRPSSAAMLPLVAVVVGMVLFLGSRAMGVNNAHLSAVLAEQMPVRTVEVVKENGYRGPLYNNFDWGGYLIWDLRMPVSLDGRTFVDGDKRLDRYFSVWGGQPGWDSDPDLKAAGLVIAPIDQPLTQLLRTDPDFQLAFEDTHAAVFTARRLHETAAVFSGVSKKQ